MDQASIAVSHLQGKLHLLQQVIQIEVRVSVCLRQAGHPLGGVPTYQSIFTDPHNNDCNEQTVDVSLPPTYLRDSTLSMIIDTTGGVRTPEK